MKKFLTTLTILIFTLFLQACNDDLQIQGSKHIYVNESQPYKAISISDDAVNADSYKWKVKSKNKDYTLTNSDSAEITFNVQSVGSYTLQVKAKKGHKPLKAEIQIEVTKPEIINGYTLPSEPDEALNNSTLLGIDVNNNGVRDDVERKIIETYKVPVKIELMMATARVGQEILENPVGLAKEHSDKMDRLGDCAMYIDDLNISFDILKSVEFYENSVYNTKSRVKAYLDYNVALSGGVYGSSPSDWVAESCDFDVDAMLRAK